MQTTRFIFFALSLFIGLSIDAQQKVKDSPLNAQTRRNTHKQWGDWLPKAKKPWWSGGVNVNPYHEMVWGWTAPMYGGSKSRNKGYQKKDIRPLAPGGQQNLRFGEIFHQSYILQDMENESDDMANMAEEQLAYNSGLLSQLDPLFQLYFKKTLKPVYNFNSSDIQKEVKDDDVYSYLNAIGLIVDHENAMLILKDRFNVAVNSDMERGQRIIFYHRLLEDYRTENAKFSYHIASTKRYLKYRKKGNGGYKEIISEPKDFRDWKNRDAEIAREVISKSKFL